MKRFLLSVVLATSLAFTSCQFDDSDIWDTLNEYGESIRDHEQRISALEELCKQMNTNIEALQTIVSALEKRDYVYRIPCHFIQMSVLQARCFRFIKLLVRKTLQPPAFYRH